MRKTFSMAFLAVLFASPAWSQTFLQTTPPNVPPRVTREVDLSGPRFGMTMLGEGTIAKLAEQNIKVGSAISQFGWQFEKRFYSNSDGVTVRTGALNVPLNFAVASSKSGPRVSIMTGFNLRR